MARVNHNAFEPVWIGAVINNAHEATWSMKLARLSFVYTHRRPGRRSCSLRKWVHTQDAQCKLLCLSWGNITLYGSRLLLYSALCLGAQVCKLQISESRLPLNSRGREVAPLVRLNSLDHKLHKIIRFDESQSSQVLNFEFFRHFYSYFI